DPRDRFSWRFPRLRRAGSSVPPQTVPVDFRLTVRWIAHCARPAIVATDALSFPGAPVPTAIARSDRAPSAAELPCCQAIVSGRPAPEQLLLKMFLPAIAKCAK